MPMYMTSAKRSPWYYLYIDCVSNRQILYIMSSLAGYPKTQNV